MSDQSGHVSVRLHERVSMVTHLRVDRLLVAANGSIGFNNDDIFRIS